MRTRAAGQRHLPARRGKRAVGMLVLGITVLTTISIGVHLIVDSRDFASHHQAVDGVVTDVRENVSCTDTGCSVAYTTTIRYQSPQWLPLHFRAALNDRLHPGSHLRVYVDTTDPGRARLDTGQDELIDGILLLAIATLALLLVAVTSRRRARRPNRSPGGQATNP